MTTKFGRVYTTGQVARMAGVSIVSVHRWIKRDPRLLATKLSYGASLLDADNVDEFLAERQKRGRPPDPQSADGEGGDVPE